jgi:hypothetical protein
VTEYDTFFDTELSGVAQDVEFEAVIRDLTPGRAKYCCKYAMVKMSADPDKYADRLWPRLGRGQWTGEPWSVQVVTWVDKIPAEWR